jgi:circadian clock protein KaiC
LYALQFLVNGATGYDEPGVFIAFEQSQSQIYRNMASVGLDVEGWA